MSHTSPFAILKTLMIPAEGLFMFCGGEEQPVPGDATFNKEGDGQKLLAPAVP